MRFKASSANVEDAGLMEGGVLVDAVAPDGAEGSKRFPPPKDVPTTWWHAAHHASVAAVVLGVAAFAPSELPSFPLVAFMFLYSDVYLAVLHSMFDREEALSLPILGETAVGFQMHHDHPVASTKGVGMYRLFCDSVRIQWLTGACGICFSGHSALAVRIIILKWIFAAYGSQFSHYWAHTVSSERPPIIRALQRLNVLLPSRLHLQGHHTPPYNKHFGIVNGLSDPILNPVVTNMSFPALFAAWAFLTLFDVGVIEALFSSPIFSYL